MRRFYALVRKTHHTTFDLDTAARLEIGWWRAHRYLQREDPQAGLADLVDALAALYGYLYGVSDVAVRDAAIGRAEAMRISDAWVAAGCDPRDPALDAERAELIRGYTALRTAVTRPA
jgi:hypothetical protein